VRAASFERQQDQIMNDPFTAIRDVATWLAGGPVLLRDGAHAQLKTTDRQWLQGRSYQCTCTCMHRRSPSKVAGVMASARGPARSTSFVVQVSFFNGGLPLTLPDAKEMTEGLQTANAQSAAWHRRKEVALRSRPTR
jgi:hypothetical protein